MVFSIMLALIYGAAASREFNNRRTGKGWYFLGWAVICAVMAGMTA